MKLKRVLSLGVALSAGIGSLGGIATATGPAATLQEGQTKSSSPSAGEPLRQNEGAMRVKALNRVAPDYPGFAKQAKIQGDVIVEVTIDQQGHVESARPLAGPPLLRQSATDAAWQWSFKPTLLDGAPVRVTGSITFRFNLGGLPNPGPKVSGSKLANEIELFLTGRMQGVPEFVSGDMAFVMVVADRLSPEFIARLKSLGFEIMGTDEQWATVTGSLPLARIRELAGEKNVRFIAPRRKDR